MPYYFVNTDDSKNPNNNHEVHKEGCRYMPISTISLGYFANAIPAVSEAKKIYKDADGCAICCPEAHHG